MTRRRGDFESAPAFVFERQGLGYVASDVSAGVAMSIDRIAQVRGELLGELTVERAPEGHIFIGRFNVSSVGDRRRTAEYLGSRTNNLGWRDTLETFCLDVLRAERAGQPFEEIGQLPPAGGVEFVVWPILPAMRPTIVYGEGGAGKSTLAAAVAVTVAAGTPTIGGWRIGAPRPVLVVDWEADQAEWNDRIAAVAKGIGIKPPAVHYRSGSASLPDQLHEIAQHIAQHDVAVLIVDSVGLALPSRGEGADANEGAVKLFSALRHLGITTLLIDHVAGADMGVERAVTKPYGSVYKFNLARNIFELRASASDADGTRHIGLYHRKSNQTALLPPVGLAVYHGTDELLFEREELEAAEANAAIPLHSRIHSLLLAGGKEVRPLADALNETPAKVRTTLHRMKALGQVTQLDGGIWAAVYRGAQHIAQHDVMPRPSLTAQEGPERGVEAAPEKDFWQ